MKLFGAEKTLGSVCNTTLNRIKQTLINQGLVIIQNYIYTVYITKSTRVLG